jgi:hypothetical protein
MHIIFGVERVIHGESAMEFHVGLKQTFRASEYPISYKGVLTFGEGFDVEGSVSLPIFDSLSICIGGGVYANKSLLGERHSRDLRKEYCADAFIAISYLY